MLIAALLLALQGAAAPAPAPAPVLPAVTFLRDTLFRPRADLGPFSAADRAAAASGRLAAAWARPAPEDTVWMRAEPTGAVLYIGTRAILTVLPADSVDPAEVLRATRRAWRDAGAADDWRLTLAAILRSAGAAVIALLAWRLLVLLGRRLKSRLLPRVTSWVRDLTVGGITLVRSSVVRRTAHLVVDVPVWGVTVLVLYAATSYALTQFAATRELGAGLGRSLVETAVELVQRAIGVVPDLLAVVMILLGVRMVIRLSDALLEAVEAGTLEVPAIHPEVARPTRKLVEILLWIFAIVLVYPFLPGSESGVFKGVSIFLGVLISLGSTGIVGNTMSGLVIMYSRAYKPGDFIEVEGTAGTVVELGMIATKLRTPKLVEVTIPNSVLVNHGVRNFSRLAAEQGVILPTTVTLGYDAPWRTVHRALTEAALATAGVRSAPSPFVLQTALNDFHVSYELNCHVDDPAARPQILGALHANIQDRCNAAGIEILSPAFEVRRAGPADTRLPPDRWEGGPPAER